MNNKAYMKIGGNKKIQICVFAHNLGNEIKSNLSNFIFACSKYEFTIYVMVNGCRDDTLNKVAEFSKNRGQVVISIEIEQGDKANAWNVFLYEYYDGSSIPVFIDGDVTVGENAIDALVEYHFDNPVYNSISSFPWQGGRSSAAWSAELLSKSQFTGNLYLLSPAFVKKIRDKNVKLPIGLIGDDSMLGFLSATDLCSGTDSPKERIGVCIDAIFYYSRLNPFRWSDIRLYYRRRIRYSLRRLQQNTIVPQLKQRGLDAMPLSAYDPFKDLDKMPSLQWRGIDNTWFDYLALRDIKLHINKGD